MANATPAPGGSWGRGEREVCQELKHTPIGTKLRRLEGEGVQQSVVRQRRAERDPLCMIRGVVWFFVVGPPFELNRLPT